MPWGCNSAVAVDRRAFLIAISTAWAADAALAAVPKSYPRSYERIIAEARREGRLTLYSATDIGEFSDVLDQFKTLYPFVAIDYQDLAAFEVYRRFLADYSARRDLADLVINSAMDLQVKLVNDRYSQPYVSPERPNMPDWAVWKNEAFAVSAEPIVFGYNRRLMPAADVPRSHDDLQQLLRTKAARYRGKIATYDPEASSTGYLYLSEDLILDKDTWDLIRALGKTRLATYTSSDEMIRRVRSGEQVFAYNLIGSYALDAQARDPNFGVVLPEDYTLVASRIALIARNAPHPNCAKLFLDFMLSRQGQGLIARRYMTPLRNDVASLYPAIDPSRVRNIRVGPALLANQDQLKRANFIREWRQAIGAS